MTDDKNVEMTIHDGSDHSNREPERATEDERSGSYDNRQLDRYISLKPAVAFGLTVLSTWEGIGITLGAGLLNGGPTTLV